MLLHLTALLFWW